MRHLLLLAVSFFSSISTADETAQRMTVEYQLDSCNFKFPDPYNGRTDIDYQSSIHSASYITLIKPVTRHSFEVSIQFLCQTLKGREAFTNMGYAYKNGQWVLIPDPNDPSNLSNMKLYKLHGSQTEGVASTYDQTTGALTERTRGLGFCLTDQKQILCGISETVGYVAYPKESRLPQVLKLLESIEFIEPTQPAPGSP